MTSLAPLLQKFFTDWLCVQKSVSVNTLVSYRDAIRLLVEFVCREKNVAPVKLKVEAIDAEMVGRFLSNVEANRMNCARTRNARLSAIRSFFSYVAISDPALILQCQRILAMPSKRYDRPSLAYLEQPEIECLLAAPDRSTWMGRRDYALLLIGLETGLRVSELTGLEKRHVVTGANAHVSCIGKGRKERATPLKKATAGVMARWLEECSGDAHSPVFATRQGTKLSRDAVAGIVKKHCLAASSGCSSLAAKRVTPHTLRHSAAMTLLHCGVDPSVVALWLGHERLETTQIYVHADLKLKQRALARVGENERAPSTFKPTDSLMAFLKGL